MSLLWIIAALLAGIVIGVVAMVILVSPPGVKR